MRRLVIVAVAAIAATALAACGASPRATTTATPTAPPRPRQAAAPPKSVAAGAARVQFVTAQLAGHRIELPRGWHAEVWAHVPGARLEAWTPEGDLLVSQPSSGQVSELIPRRDHAAPPAQRVVLSGLNDPQGLAFATDAGREVLYVAEADAIDRYAWQAGRPVARRVIVAGLPEAAPPGSDDHILKNVVVGPTGRIYVDIGSGSNASPPAATHPPRAAVVSYTANGTGERIVATGVRNGDGLSFAPDGTLWSAINERDQIPYPFHRAYGGFADAYGEIITAYVNEHPPDEIARLTPGRDLGWPYCDPDPDVQPGASGTALRYADLPFLDDEQTNPGGARLDCAKLRPLDRGLPAHSAPLGFHFLQGTDLPARWREGAIVAVHGSWDREPPRAPAVLWLPWDPATRTLGAPLTFLGGFQYPDGSRWGRPVDAVAGPDGALYVSDDTAGAIYRLAP